MQRKRTKNFYTNYKILRFIQKQKMKNKQKKVKRKNINKNALSKRKEKIIDIVHLATLITSLYSYLYVQ